jgi:ferric-dicitrate binding protein FerR (iron transport regulator)
MEETLYTDLIAKYLSGNIAAAERKTLFAWVEADAENRRFFEQMVQLWSLTDQGAEASYQTDSTAAWSKLEEHLFGETKIATVVPLPSSKKTGLRAIKHAGRAAAAVFLLAMVGLWWFKNNAKTDAQTIVYQTDTNEKDTIQLPDGSTIWLNENTRLSFSEKFTPRLVELDGEAFFAVTHQNGNLFKIVSGNAETTVLGTTFNVRAYPNEANVEVTVATGKVALQNKNDERAKVELTAGESAFFDNTTRQVQENPQPLVNADAWKTRRLDFRNLSTQAIIQTMERYFDIDVEVENPRILNCDLSMTQALDDPQLTDIFQQMEFTWNVTIVKKDQQYIIQGAGCE